MMMNTETSGDRVYHALHTSPLVLPSTFSDRYWRLKLALRLAGILDSSGPAPACASSDCGSVQTLCILHIHRFYMIEGCQSGRIDGNSAGSLQSNSIVEDMPVQPALRYASHLPRLHSEVSKALGK